MDSKKLCHAIHGGIYILCLQFAQRCGLSVYLTLLAPFQAFTLKMALNEQMNANAHQIGDKSKYRTQNINIDAIIIIIIIFFIVVIIVWQKLFTRHLVCQVIKMRVLMLM